MAGIEDSAHFATTPSSGRLEQGRLFGPPPASPPDFLVVTLDLPHDPRAGADIVVLNTRHRGPDTCFGRRHRCRQGETVQICTMTRDGDHRVVRTGPDLYPRRGWEWMQGVVLTEGFDAHGRHVGWVGVPGETVLWRQLCALTPGDDAELARDRERAEAAGLGVQVRVW